MKSNIYEVAKLAGVSTATVSRVFNKKHKVSPEVEGRVLDAATQLNYAPKFAARGNTVGIIITAHKAIEFGDYSDPLIAGMSRRLFELEYSVEIVATRDLPYLHRNSMRAFISLCDEIGKTDIPGGVPVFSINCPLPDMHNIYTDHAGGIGLAIDYLVECGHRKIGFLGAMARNWGNTEREEGYRESLHRHGIEFDKTLMQHAEPDKSLEALLKMFKASPTALIAAGESKEMAVAYALNLLEKKVPDDISLVCFENRGISKYSNPPHTTVSQNLENVGAAAVQQMHEILEGKSKGLVNLMLPNRVIERESVKRIG